MKPILNTLSEGSTTYALLTDGRILAKELDDKHCAELHAEQVLRLQIAPEKLLGWYGWRVEESA